MTNTSPITDRPLEKDHTSTTTDPFSHIKQLEQRLDTLSEELNQLKIDQPTDRMTIVVFSGDMDKLMSAFIIASGAAAMGSQVYTLLYFLGSGGDQKSDYL